jgi:amyloid beta precursor protein binding protein 1
MEKKEKDIQEDLRLSAPFPALEQFAASMNMDEPDDQLHSHIPYVAILLSAMDKWKSTHEGSKPVSMAQKAEFKTMVKEMARSSKEINFEEAVNNIFKVYPPFEEPYTVTQNDKAEFGSTADNSSFWCLGASLKEFIKRHGTNPVAGHISDMTSTTDFYLQI